MDCNCGEIQKQYTGLNYNTDPNGGNFTAIATNIKNNLAPIITVTVDQVKAWLTVCHNNQGTFVPDASNSSQTSWITFPNDLECKPCKCDAFKSVITENGESLTNINNDVKNLLEGLFGYSISIVEINLILDKCNNSSGGSFSKFPETLRCLGSPVVDEKKACIYDAIQMGIPLSRIHEITKIDMWFLKQYEELYLLEKEISAHTLEELPRELLLEAKQKGYGDRQIAHMLKCLESEVYKRREDLNIQRVYKLVDTCAAEFKAETPYYYSTFENDMQTADGSAYAENDSIVTPKKKIIVLGSGPNRIGQGIEFDYCCVHGVLAAAECGYETIMINCNPETVSTDFDVADKLYFEPVFWEHIYDIIRHEKPEGVIVQLGGQTALKLAEKLERYGIKIIGTTYKALDLAEDRGSFSTILKDNNIPYPEFGVAETTDEALALADQLNFPLLIRPSYVLGGQGMKIVINKKELEEHVVDLLRKIPNNKLLLDHYLDGAIEAEADAICDGENVYIIGIMEHIEPCGIHSGDSNATLPPFNLGEFVMQQIKDHTKKIALALNTVGLINVQFAVKDDIVYIIEANPRASRTVPFISKAYKEPYVNYATKVMLGEKKVTDFKFNPELDGYAIKQPVFSFNKFPNVNKQLGPEMKSTGESILFIDSLKDDAFYDLYSRRKMYLSK